MNLFFKTKNTTCSIFLIALILGVFAFGTPLSAFAKPIQVAIVPFKVNSEKDLSFLKDGIVDMLSSRLYREDKVNIINRQATEKAAATVGGPLNESKARTLGTQLGANYVLFGSLTVFGNSVSIDAKMVDVSGKKQTLTFFNQSQSMDQVIPGIDLFASDINEKEFGRVMETRQAAPAAGTSSPQAGLPQTDVRAHPDKLIAGGIVGSELQKDQKGGAPGSAFITTEMGRSQGTKFWKSRNIKQRITGMAIGDIDGDGKKETVFTTEHTVEAYRYDNQRFIKIGTLAERNLDHLIGVDVADINGNGVAEIYVSALDPYRKYVKSFVVELTGKSYTEIVKTTDWYLRVVEMPQRGKVLIGQKQGLESPFNKPIFELVWQNSGYDSAERVLGAKRANVMGISLGYVMNDGSETAVVYDDLDYLRMYDLSGKQIWKDGDKSGGSPDYFQLPNMGSADMENHAYYPMRILIQDINKDGKNDVITIKNNRLSELISLRSFTSGEIEVRNWDGIGLSVLWKTRKLSGYFSDFGVGDFDNDGKDELVAALVLKTGSVITTQPKSTFIAYELE